MILLAKVITLDVASVRYHWLCLVSDSPTATSCASHSEIHLLSAVFSLLHRRGVQTPFIRISRLSSVLILMLITSQQLLTATHEVPWDHPDARRAKLSPQKRSLDAVIRWFFRIDQTRPLWAYRYIGPLLRLRFSTLWNSLAEFVERLLRCGCHCGRMHRRATCLELVNDRQCVR